MPLMYGNNSNGCFVKWGESGKEYYYQCGNERSQKLAKKRALKQRNVILANQKKVR